MNILTENSIKGVLSKIASDIKNKVSVGDMGNYISDYFKNNTENNVDLESAVVDIINNNVNTIDLNSVVLTSINDYFTEHPVSLNNYYTKSEVETLINNAIQNGGGNNNPKPQPLGKGTSDFISSSKLNLNGLNTSSLEDADNPLYSNRILFLKDDFEGDTLDENLFSMSDGREPNYKISTFKPANVTVHDSMMTLLGQKAESVDAIDGTTRPFTGAQVITRLHFQNCLFECKMRHPHERAWCTAYWTCGYNVTGLQNWSYCGEIDIFEDIDNEKKSTFHYAKDNSLIHSHAVAMSRTVIDNDTLKAFGNSGGDGEWHIYGCELMQGKVRLYFDHVLFAEYDTGSQSYYEGVNPYDYWQHFIWDSVAWRTEAKDMNYKVDVDWVRAWSLEGETATDLIPQSVQLSYLGNEERVEANNKIKSGTIAQLRPVYVPSTVPVIGNLDTASHKTFTLSNDNFIEDGGAIKPVVNGKCDVVYMDVFNNTVTNTYNAYNDINLLPNKNVNLEDFNVTTAPCIYGVPKITSNSTGLNGEWVVNNKRITYGLFKVTPSTTYTFTNNGNKSNSAILLYEFSSENKCLGTYGTRLSYDVTSFTTKENTAYVLMTASLADKLVLDDYRRIKAMLINYNPKFTKVVDNPEEPIMGHATSEHISPEILNLNGLDKTKFDDVSNTSLYDNRTLFFADDFEGDSLDENMYSIDEKADSANGCIYGRDGIEVQDSIVKMTTELRPKEYNGHTYQFKAGRFMTNFEFQNCLVESKIRNTRLQGKNEAFWTCGYSIKSLRSWAYCGEIDIFEDANGSDGLNKHVTFHYNKDYGTHSVEMPKTIVDDNVYNLFKKNSGDNEWHIYGCELSSSGIIKFYFDHVLFMEVDTTNRTYPNDFNPFKYAQHFIWEACTWDKNSEGTATIEVDWIRAWSLENKTPVDLIPQSVTLKDTGSKASIEDGNRIRTGTFVQLAPIYTPSSVPMIMNLDAVKNTEFKTLDYPTEYIESQGGLGIKPIKDGQIRITYTDLFGVSCSKEYVSYSKDISNGETNLEDFNYLTDNYKYGRYELPAIGKPLTTWILGRSICFGLYKVEPLTAYNVTFSNFGNPIFEVGILDNNKNVISKFDITPTNNLSFTTPKDAKYILIQYTVDSSAAVKELFHIHKLFIEQIKPSFTKENSTKILCTAINANEEIEVGKSTQLEYSIEPIGCTEVVTFTSNDTSIATVDDNGIIRPISNGNTTITLTCGEIVKTISVTVNFSSSDEPTTSYKLPEDLNTALYVNNDLLFASKFPYHAIIHDKFNNMYYLHCTNSPILNTGYSEKKGCVYTGVSKGQILWATMRWNSPSFPNLRDYFDSVDDGRIRKTSTMPVSSGTYYYAEDTEAGLKSVSTIDDIEVIYANYSIEGLYTANVPCEALEVANMELTTSKPTMLSYKITPMVVTDELTFTSNDTSVAVIKEDGLLYPQSNGVTDITVKCGKYTKTCKVTIALPSKDLTNKTIVRSNYSPNGEAFVDENIDWNKDTDTIFVSLTDTNASENQSIFSVGSNASKAGSWENGTIHTVYPYTKKKDNNKFLFSTLMGGEVKTIIPMSSDNKVKIAINKYNIYVNGNPVLENGTWEKTCNNQTQSSRMSFYNNLINSTKIALGSTEGTSRSFADYEEISIHHNLYTSSEMKQLTTV